MNVETRYIQFHVKKDEIRDITDQVAKELSDTGMQDGTVTVFCPGSTGGLSTVEYEPGLVETDIPKLLEKLAPEKDDYAHHFTWHDYNGYGHVRAFLIGPSITIPFVKGRLTLGTWQQVIFLNMDDKSRSRRLVLQFMGT
ncbi:MAG: secondary thiamine-phosphate synthase enzyme YjbQ [Candidatus Hodarchaeota archaeon]